MLTHAQIWAAIDSLAAREGTSTSGLARRAGLDATTFNRSKRQNEKGQLRWPSTESIAKVLSATGVAIDEFLDLRTGHAAEIPCRVLDGRVDGWFTEAGKPTGKDWDRMSFAGEGAPDCFALELADDACLPCYRAGTVLVLRPESAHIRRGDRMLLVLKDGTTRIATYLRETRQDLHLAHLTSGEAMRFARNTLALRYRILWASQ